MSLKCYNNSLPEDPAATNEYEPRAHGSALHLVTSVSFGWNVYTCWVFIQLDVLHFLGPTLIPWLVKCFTYSRLQAQCTEDRIGLCTVLLQN